MLGGRSHMEVERNTYLHRISQNKIGLKFYNDDLFIIERSKMCLIVNQKTRVTKNRINSFLEFLGKDLAIIEKNGVWYWNTNQKPVKQKTIL